MKEVHSCKNCKHMRRGNDWTEKLLWFDSHFWVCAAHIDYRNKAKELFVSGKIIEKYERCDHIRVWCYKNSPTCPEYEEKP